MSADIGRSAAVLVAIIMCVLAPVLVRRDIVRQSEEFMVQDILDTLCSNIQREEGLDRAMYDRFVADLAATGRHYEVTMVAEMSYMLLDDPVPQL